MTTRNSEKTGAVRCDLAAFYGTLMRGHSIQDALGLRGVLEFRGECVIRGRLIDLGDYPGLVEDEDSRVRGELYRVSSSSAWRVLDAYEGCQLHAPDRSLFIRRIRLLEKPAVSSWIYIYNGGTPGRF